MCIICVSKVGERQPTKKEFAEMFRRNPHGSGYMFARDGKVEIHKGFMSFAEFYRNVSAENFGKDDAVVYHFRIATQGGINPYMTHPFALTKDLDTTKALDITCPLGIAHNGIIRLTSDGDKVYSDTAKFITEYMTRIVRKDADIRDKTTLEIIEILAQGRWALLDKSGYIATIGDWKEDNGLLFSNDSYKPSTYYYVNQHGKTVPFRLKG